MTDQPQNMRALTYGNAVRYRRAEVHREVRALPFTEAKAMVADILLNLEPAWRTMRAYELIRWPKKTNPNVAYDMLVAAGVSHAQVEMRLVGELSLRQRQVLADLLRGGDAEDAWSARRAA